MSLWALVVLLSIGALALAAGPGGDSGGGGNSGGDAPLVDWSHAQQAHRLIEKWVLEGKTDDPSQGQPIRVSGLSAVRVTLRSDGQTMGVGEVELTGSVEAQTRTTGKGGTKGNIVRLPAVDLRAAVARATNIAMREVNETLSDVEVKTKQQAGLAAPATTAPAKIKTKTIVDIAPLIQVDLQLACQLTPIELLGPSDPTEIYSTFIPGHHGLRLARAAGDRKKEEGLPSTSWIWPGVVVASNISPRSQLVQLLADVGYSPGAAAGSTEIQKIARPNGPMLWRFDVIHMVRVANDLPLEKLVRGNRILPPVGLDSRTLDAVAGKLSDFLSRRMRDDGVMTGTFHPSSDSYDPPTAQRYEAALALYALGRQIDYLNALGQNDAQKGALLATVRKLLEPLLQNLTAQGHSDDPAAIALVVMTLNQTPGLEDRKRERDLLLDVLLKLRNEDGSFRTNLPVDAGAVSAPVQALIVAALAQHVAQTQNGAMAKMVRQSQQMLWTKPDVLHLSVMMPWLLQGELAMRKLDDVNDAPSTARWNARIAAMAKLNQWLSEKQIKQPSATGQGPNDIVGGFDLSDHPVQAFPNPDWRTTQMLAFEAIAVREEALLPRSQVPEQLVTGGLAARFIAQLMFDEPSCYYVRGREQVLGGVRLSLWDNRLGPSPAAMGLLAVTELQLSLQRLGTLSKSPQR